MPALIEIQNHGPIRELRLARPPVNALDPALCLALRDAVHQAAADDVDGVVLAGGPSVFSGGLDVPHLLALDGSGALRAAWDAFFSAARALAEAPMPIAAARSTATLPRNRPGRAGRRAAARMWSVVPISLSVCGGRANCPPPTTCCSSSRPLATCKNRISSTSTTA